MECAQHLCLEPSQDLYSPIGLRIWHVMLAFIGTRTYARGTITLARVTHEVCVSPPPSQVVDVKLVGPLLVFWIMWHIFFSDHSMFIHVTQVGMVCG